MSRQVIVAFVLFGLVAALGMVPSQSNRANAQESVTVPVGDIWFCTPTFENGVCVTEVAAGDTVFWDFSVADLPHTTTACGASCDSPTSAPLWDSGILEGGSYQFTFNEPGTYLYYCMVHPLQQRGQIVVAAAQEPVDPGPTGSDDVQPGVTPGVIVPPTVGSGPGSASGGTQWLATMLAGAGLALGSLSLVLRGARRHTS